MQHTALHCETLQHAATNCNKLQYRWAASCCGTRWLIEATRCNTLQHAATRCNTLQHAATRCNTRQHKWAASCCIYTCIYIYNIDIHSRANHIHYIMRSQGCMVQHTATYMGSFMFYIYTYIYIDKILVLITLAAQRDRRDARWASALSTSSSSPRTRKRRRRLTTSRLFCCSVLQCVAHILISLSLEKVAGDM